MALNAEHASCCLIVPTPFRDTGVQECDIFQKCFFFGTDKKRSSSALVYSRRVRLPLLGAPSQRVSCKPKCSGSKHVNRPTTSAGVLASDGGTGEQSADTSNGPYGPSNDLWLTQEVDRLTSMQVRHQAHGERSKGVPTDVPIVHGCVGNLQCSYKLCHSSSLWMPRSLPPPWAHSACCVSFLIAAGASI